jgi:hypothetical protein
MTLIVLWCSIVLFFTLFSLAVNNGVLRFFLVLVVLNPIFAISFSIGILVLELSKYYLAIWIPSILMTIIAVYLLERLDRPSQHSRPSA